VLELDQVGLDHDFFALGGNSIVALGLVTHPRAGRGRAGDGVRRPRYGWSGP
jgi:phosphopantetheine binding protein